MIHSAKTSGSHILAMVLTIIALTGCATNTSATLPSKRAAEEAAVLAATIARGDAALQAGRLDEALVQYIAAAEQDPKSDAALLRIAQLHESSGTMEPAIRALQLAAQRDLRQGLTPQRLGFLSLRVGDDEHAGKYFTQALELDSRLWPSRMGLGLIAEQSGDLASARRYYDDALTMQPKSAELLAYSARTHLALGNVERAREQVSLSLAITPSSAARLVWGDLRAQAGDYSHAFDSYQTVLTTPLAYQRVGERAMERNDYASAVKFLETAARISPTYLETAHQRLAVAREYLAAGRR